MVAKSCGLSFTFCWRLAATQLLVHFMLLKLTREIQAFSFLEAFLQPDHAQHTHSSVKLCFTGCPQCQHLSDLPCIPWSPLKSVLGITTMWISCAGACALLWDIPNPTLTLRLHKDHPHEPSQQPGFTLDQAP